MAVDPASNAGIPTDITISENMSLDTIFMLLAIDRSQVLDETIFGMSEDMKNTNDRINGLNDAMAAVRSVRPSGDADKSEKKEVSAEQAAAIQSAIDEGADVPSSLKIHRDSEDNITHIEGKPAAFDAFNENIKTKVDALSSNSQLDMIKLQGLINKRNQTIEMASNVMQKINQSLSNIISNLR